MGESGHDKGWSLVQAHLQAWEGSQRLMEKWRREGTHRDVLRGCHGLFIDLIDCDSSYFPAVEVGRGMGRGGMRGLL